MTTATTPARVATGGRDRYFDVLRTACIVWVVFYHVFATQAWLGFWPAMGILFALSSSLMVRSLDRSTLKTLRSRLQRLLPVLWLLAVFAVPAMFLKGWPADQRPPLWRMVFWVIPIADPPGSAWAESAVEPLWYLRSLVWFILLSPILLILFRWYPKTLMLGSIGILVALGTKRIGFDWTGEVASAVLVDGFTFLACWLLGFAHREGMLKKIPVGVVVPAGLALASFGTYWVLTHKVNDGPGDPASYDFNLFDMAQGLYSLGIAAILLRFSPKFAWIGNYKFLDRAITIINGRAMVIYLWHNIAIELSYPIADRFDVWQYGNTAATSICLAVALLLTAAGVLAFGWIEDVAAGRRPQLLPKELGKKGAAPAAPEAATPAADEAGGAYPSEDVHAANTVMFSPVGAGQNGYDRHADARYGSVGNDRQQQYDNGGHRAYSAYSDQPYDDQRGYDDRSYDDRRYEERGYRDSQYDGRQREDRYYEEPRYDDRRPSGRRPDERRYSDDRPYEDDRRYEQPPRDDRAYGRPADPRPALGRPPSGRATPDRGVLDRGVPDRATPDRATPDRGGSDRGPSDQGRRPASQRPYGSERARGGAAVPPARSPERYADDEMATRAARPRGGASRDGWNGQPPEAPVPSFDKKPR